MVGKKNYRYTNVELLDLIRNSQNESFKQKAIIEFKKRNLTDKEKQQIELDYLKYKEFQEKRKNESLTNNEWLTFLFLPFLTPKPRWRDDHYSESEIERFNTHGFDKKLNPAEKVRSFGYAFWFLLTLVAVLLYAIFELI